MINADKPHLWKKDIAASVDCFNAWFMKFAPVAYREARVDATEQVKNALVSSDDFRSLSPAMLRDHPEVVTTLRMATAPPIARDRLVGLAHISRNLVTTMERGHFPPRASSATVKAQLERICGIIESLLDRDIFPWLEQGGRPNESERNRAATIVADRLCGAVTNPIIRNAQEKRQLAAIGNFLDAHGYRREAHPTDRPITDMQPGTYSFRMNVPVDVQGRAVNIPVDVVIQPVAPKPHRFPRLIEAKSAGDFANTNKRRKEEATKIHQLRDTYGSDVQLTLFLCGYFDSGYLGYEAAEGMDWIWEHRIEDITQLGL